MVQAFLAQRPEPDGFPRSEFVAAGTFEGYVARQLFWHFRGALGESEEVPNAWVTHSDNGILANVAMAVGLDALVALSEARESAGDLVIAAHIAWTATMVKGLESSSWKDITARVVDLLERRRERHRTYRRVWSLTSTQAQTVAAETL